MNYKMRFVFIMFLFFFCSSFVFSNEFPYIGYVISRDGLNQRESPSSTSRRIGTLFYGSSVIVYGRSDNTETINGITDYWYNCQYDGQFWLFGAYLSKEMPSDTLPVIGRWLTNKGDIYRWEFTPNNIVRYGRRETGNIWTGAWSLLENVLTIITEPQYSSDDMREANIIQKSQKIEITITVINRDRIHLYFTDGSEEILDRNNNIY